MRNRLLIGLATTIGLVSSLLSVPGFAATSVLDQVMQRKVVRVCTTGDYKPFSYRDQKSAKLRGIDIDMARNMAKLLGVKVQFVHTSWSNLMKDFTAGKCDIAMGGISITLPRQKHAYFSIPYLTDGKTPITLCKNADRYRTMQQIDRPSVTVVVNPGGSNARFAQRHLQHAKIDVYPDNTKIFGQIINGNADLMITDSSETRMQASIHPELCAVHPDKPFTYSEKGYLLPRGDNVWKAWVDQWLHLALKTGEFKTVYQSYFK